MTASEYDLAIERLCDDLAEMEAGRLRHYHAVGYEPMTDCTSAMIQTSKHRIEWLRQLRLLALR